MHHHPFKPRTGLRHQALRAAQPLAAALTLSIVQVACAPAQVLDPQLNSELLTLTGSAGLPAAAIASFSCTDRRIAWSGVTQAGESQPVGPYSRFNIGSNAKSMLAVAAIRLETRSVLSLTASLSELWPEAVQANPAIRDITLGQLLSHTSGLQAFSSGRDLETVPLPDPEQGSITQQAALWFLEQPLAHEPGSTALYSNAGYVVAGAILERVTGLTVDDVIRNEVFEPLGISAAFGEPRRLGQDEPYGHYVSEGAITTYAEDEPPLPDFLLAAGNVAISLSDYTTYLQAHLCALQGLPNALLSPEAAQRLHAPALPDGPAYGWGVTTLEGRVVSFHIGGTGDFTAYAALAPDADLGAAALTNVGGEPAAVLQSWLISEITKP